MFVRVGQMIRWNRGLLAAVALVFVPLATAQASFSIPTERGPSGMAVQFKPADASAQALATAQAGGFQMIRKAIYWNGVETTKGVYDFTSNDAFFKQTQALGLAVNVTLFGGNSLYGETGLGIHTGTGRQGFADFAAAVASHYKGYKFSYEIYNEPNTRTFWGGTQGNTAATADEYYELVALVAPAMKKADPNAYVVAGSISCMWSASWIWLDEILKDGILKTGIDGISVHPYGFHWPEQTLTGTYSWSALRSKMNAAGGSKLSIVVSEVGYSTSSLPVDLGVTTAEAEAAQGWLLVREQLVDLIAGNGYSVWYQLRDSSTGFAVVTSAFAPLPAYTAAKTYATALSGYHYVSRQNQADASNYVVLFENAAKAQKLVVWTSTNNASHEISIPVSGSGSLDVVATDGTASKVAIAGGEISVALTGAPQYITLPPLSLKNVALKKAVTASSGQGSAKNLVDGNITSTNSRWFSNSGYPQSVVIDLAGTYSISKVNYLQYTQRTSGYTVEVYNGSAWVKVVSVADGNTATDISTNFTAVNASKIRFTITKGVLYQKAFELQVMGLAP